MGGYPVQWPRPNLDPAPFGAVLSLAGNAYADRVAPEHFWGYGWR